MIISCAQVKVTGGGSGTPGPTVKIPGVYKQDDAAVNFSIWGSQTEYNLIPGPQVWTGGASSAGNASGAASSAASGAAAASSAVVRPASTLATRVKVPTTTAVAPAAPVVSNGSDADSGACEKKGKGRFNRRNIRALA